MGSGALLGSKTSISVIELAVGNNQCVHCEHYGKSEEWLIFCGAAATHGLLPLPHPVAAGKLYQGYGRIDVR